MIRQKKHTRYATIGSIAFLLVLFSLKDQLIQTLDRYESSDANQVKKVRIRRPLTEQERKRREQEKHQRAIEKVAKMVKWINEIEEQQAELEPQIDDKIEKLGEINDLTDMEQRNLEDLESLNQEIEIDPLSLPKRELFQLDQQSLSELAQQLRDRIEEEIDQVDRANQALNNVPMSPSDLSQNPIDGSLPPLDQVMEAYLDALDALSSMLPTGQDGDPGDGFGPPGTQEGPGGKLPALGGGEGNSLTAGESELHVPVDTIDDNFYNQMNIHTLKEFDRARRIAASTLPGRHITDKALRQGYIFLDTFYIIGPFPLKRSSVADKVTYADIYPPDTKVNLSDEFVFHRSKYDLNEYQQKKWLDPIVDSQG